MKVSGNEMSINIRTISTSVHIDISSNHNSFSDHVEQVLTEARDFNLFAKRRFEEGMA